MDAETKNYELAYLASPSLKPEEISAFVSELQKSVEEAGGTIRKSGELKKIPLAYRVKKQNEAHFGWTDFSSAPAGIPLLQKKLKNSRELLRHLLLEKEETAALKPYFSPLSPAGKPAARQRFEAKAAPKKIKTGEEQKLDLEALDKKLEEILGK